MSRPELVLWPSDLPARPRAPQAVVVIHGILSSHRTFDVFAARLIGDPRFRDFDVYYYDYDYNDSLERNGELLAAKLAGRFAPGDSVFIVAHSMGGLVARLAVLSRHLPFVRCLFLLGTPNVGAIRTAQVAMLAQLATATLRATFAVFPRKRGISDLTIADRILARKIDDGRNTNADHVAYVTLPGLLFNEGRSYWQLGRDVATVVFSLMRLGLGAVDALLPALAIRLGMPHDGIVEAASNNLSPSEAGRMSEKNGAMNFPKLYPLTYLHVRTRSGERLNHVQLQSDQAIYDVVADIIHSPDRPPGSRLLGWYRGLDRRRSAPLASIGPEEAILAHDEHASAGAAEVAEGGA
jgi:pimeloyl-ACP methyl ester carboxylesterase